MFLSSTPRVWLELAAASRAELEALQLHKLRRQLARLHASSGYYRRRMDGAGIAA